MREVEECGSRMISINDADFFGTREHPKQVMKALKGRGISWQAGVTSKLAQDDEMLELAADSGCSMLSIGFESVSRETLRSVHKHVNRPEQFAALVEKVHSYGIMVFGLFMFGFDGDDTDVFQETAQFNVDADFDACAYSVLTPYPGTLTWYDMKKAGRIHSFDWEKYDQANVVYRPEKMSGEDLRRGHISAYETFYSPASMLRRFPLAGKRSRLQWSIYNLFMKKGSASDRKQAIPDATAAPDLAPVPPVMPIKREWRNAVLEAIGDRPGAGSEGAGPSAGPGTVAALAAFAARVGTLKETLMRIVAIALGVLAMPVAAFAAGTTAETAGPSGPAGRIADAFVELGMSDNRAACYGGVIQENLGPDAANEAAAIVEAAQTSEEVRAGVQQSTGETINAFMMAQDQCGGGS